jgi:hypothetical protein
MLRALALLFGLALVPAPGFAAEAAAPAWSKVEIAPTKTSIYVGTVSMTMPSFSREGETFVSSYTARVFPYFFYNEKGTLTVNVTDAQLARLAHGETIDFSGRAVRSDGAERRVLGTATPKDAGTGALKVRVIVSKKIELIFHTTYRFE